MCAGSEIRGFFWSFSLSQWEKSTLIGIPDAVTTGTPPAPPYTHTHLHYSQLEGGAVRQKVWWGRRESHFKEPYCSFAFSPELWLISIHTCRGS